MKVDIVSAVVLASLAGVSEATDPFLSKPKPYSQDFFDNYNLLKYTSWMGPWSQRRGVGINRDPPAGCRVDQVAMLHRHGERYPDGYTSVAQEKVLKKLEGKKGKLEGSLAFYNDWIPYTNHKDGWIAQESTFGPYAGLLDGYNRGALYRVRYGHLYDGESTLPIWTSGYERIADTARFFGKGFLGYNYTELAALQIIPETADMGANSLVPVCNTEKATNCKVNNPEAETAWPDDAPWDYEEFERAAKRLNKENGLNLTATDIPDLISLAPFELNIRGSSPWVQVFTAEEWVAFEYLQSAFYYCYAGPGSPTTKPTGYLYLNATRELLNQGPKDAQPLYFSFAHDTDITPVVSLLGFASPKNISDYDPTTVTFNQLWDVADITPQGAHIVFERLICDEEDVDEEDNWPSTFPAAFNATNITNTTHPRYAGNYSYPIPNGTVSGNSTGSGSGSESKKSSENIYVRIVLNEAVAPLPGCAGGPGKSCKLSDFNEYVDKAIGDASYKDQCNPEDDVPDTLTFFWNWNDTNALNNVPAEIPYQAGLLFANGSAIPKKQ